MIIFAVTLRDLNDDIPHKVIGFLKKESMFEYFQQNGFNQDSEHNFYTENDEATWYPMELMD